METPHFSGENFGQLSEESNVGFEKKKNAKKKRPVAEAAPDQPVSESNETLRRERLKITEAALPLWQRLTRKSAEAQDQEAEATIFSSRKESLASDDEANSIRRTTESAELSEDADAEIGEDLVTPDEEWEIVATYVETRNAELENEQRIPTANAVDQRVAGANATFMQALAQKVEQGVQGGAEASAVSSLEVENVAQAVEEAYQETIRQYASSEAYASEATAVVEENVTADSEVASRSATYAAQEWQRSTKAAQEDQDAAATMSAAAVGAGGMPPYSSASGGGTHTMNSGGGGTTLSMSRGHNELAPTGSRQPEAANDWLAPAAVTAVVAYWLGRRHGRNKTEKRLLPEKKRLEAEVTNLLATINNKESQVRQLVRRQAESEAATANRPQRPDLLSALPTQQAEKSPVARVLERTTEAPLVRASETAPIRMPIEAVTPQFVSRAEGRAVPIPVETARAETAMRQAAPVEAMGRKELLEAGAAITIGSESLRSVYEDHKISEQGLRRLVTEYRRGGDIGHVLKDEMLKHELSFEHDPLDNKDDPEQPLQPKERAAQASVHTVEPMAPSWVTQDSSGSAADRTATIIPPTVPDVPRSARSRSPHPVEPMLAAANVAAFVVLLILFAVLLIIWL